jgi:DNA replication and repair protein RecF
VWVGRLEVFDLRNLAEARLDLSPGLNVFVGRNAQGKTSLLESVALLARGRSFRTDLTASLIRRGSSGLRTRAHGHGRERDVHLEVEVTPEQRRFRVDGREVSPGDYQGRLEAVVYSTDRLRVISGPMRERRSFLDRAGAALWPAYRQSLRDFERVLRQRNAALEAQRRDLETWDEQFAELGAALRRRRAAYAEKLQAALRAGLHPAGETYELAVCPQADQAGVEALRTQMRERRADELRARRSLVGPHRDAVHLRVDGEEVATWGSSGQARSLLLGLALAALDVYRAERGEPAVALLDDLDSELDEERASALCHRVALQGQALVTTAHPGWARRLAPAARLFEVEGGAVRTA